VHLAVYWKCVLLTCVPVLKMVYTAWLDSVVLKFGVT
jgi:hypothetical protein